MNTEEAGLETGYWASLHWIGALAGAAAAAVDIGLILAFGVEMLVAGVDAALPVTLFLGANYAAFGYVIGRMFQERRRSRLAATVIETQLRELEHAQRALIQQEKMAAIGRVAAGVAHEVRNPLGVIRASAAMIQESFREGEDPHRACEFICEEADRLNSLITALLSYSRPTELRRHRGSLDEMVERALSLAGDDLRERRIELAREREAGLPELEADPDLVSQVVYGLVSNAGEALGQGGRIAVRTSRVAGALRVDVADSGAGVEPGIAPQIFEPFFTTKATGTGLGLPMAERIAQAHGGRLECVRGAGAGSGGQGACFRLELPLGPAASTAPAGLGL